MDKEWVRDKLLRAGTEVTDESNDECDAGWLAIPRPSVDVLAEAISQAAEEEMVAAQEKWPIETVLLLGQLRVSTGLIKQAKQQLEHLETESAGLRAQVAMALALADSWEEYDGEWGEIDPGRCICADNLRQALSAAPKVLHREQVKWDTEWLVWPVVRLERPLMLDAVDPNDVLPGVTFMVHGPSWYKQFPGQRATLVILAEPERPRHPEQAQESEQEEP